ncbi:mobile element protein [Streptomyces sp. NPDC052164]|uniref:mobile element protein n=1 Tax=Streptomyces sp. NPDC052164 TaxID=3155529 RepID=UPI003417C7D2
MATDDYLADPEELAILTGKPATDPRLLQHLKNATRRFRGAVGHKVNLVENDEVVLDGLGRASVLLPVWPTTAVHSVRLDGVLLAEGVGYQWSDSGVLRRLGCDRWPDRLRCLRVIYSHGWATVPEDVAEAVLDKAATMAAVPHGVASKAVGGQSVTYGTQAAVGVTDQWQKCVDRYRIRTAGDA